MKTTLNCMQILFLFSLTTSNSYHLALRLRNVKTHSGRGERGERRLEFGGDRLDQTDRPHQLVFKEGA